MSTVLLTGATGFVGRAASQTLLAAGHRVLGLGRSRASSMVPGVEHLPADLSSPSDDWPLSELGTVDAVLHLAGLAHRRGDPAEHARINRDATLALADWSLARGIRRFVFVSSWLVSDDDEGFYVRSKREAEEGLQRAFAQAPERLRLLRPALVYGPGAGGNLAWLMRAIDAGWLPPFPPQLGHRPMIAREDLAAALLAALGDDWPAAVPVPICDGEYYSLRRIARALTEARGATYPTWQLDPRCWRLGGRLGDGVRRLTGMRGLPDSATVTRMFRDIPMPDQVTVPGWAPRHRFEEAVTAMWQAWDRGR